MEESMFTLQNLWNLIVPIGIIVLAFILGLILKKVIMLRLVKLSKKTHTEADDIVIKELNRPFIFWCLLIGLYFAVRSTPLSKEWLNIAGKTIAVLAIFSVTVFLVRLVIGILNMPSGRLRKLLPDSSLTQSMAKIFIYGIGVLIILNTLGISITPILTAFGLGGSGDACEPLCGILYHNVQADKSG